MANSQISAGFRGKSPKPCGNCACPDGESGEARNIFVVRQALQFGPQQLDNMRALPAKNFICVVHCRLESLVKEVSAIVGQFDEVVRVVGETPSEIHSDT